MVLSDEEVARYSRQLLLPGMGVVTQEFLRAARIQLVGGGPVAGPAMLYLAQAGEFGSAVQQVVEQMLQDTVLEQVHQAGRLLRLAEKYGHPRLNAACQRALSFGDPAYKTVKGILKHNLDQESQPTPVQIPPASTFSRQTGELVGALAEVARWS